MENPGENRNNNETHIKNSFYRLYSIVKTLRSDEGCAWDREQTVTSLLPNLIEESYELFEAVEEGSDKHSEEELGDLFLLLTMMSYIMEQEKRTALPDIFKVISEKLIRRHPHVFTEEKLNDPEMIIKQWNQIKKDVEGRDDDEDLGKHIPKTMPPLERALKIQKKVSALGFDWETYHGVFDKIREELGELEDEVALLPEENLRRKISAELGDLLFSVVNLARYIDIDPMLSLHSTNQKFIKRFNYVTAEMQKKGVEVSKKNMDSMEELWLESKKLYP